MTVQHPPLYDFASRRSLAVNGRGWYCHLCKRGGSVLDLMMELHGTTLSGAAERLCAMMGVSVPYLGTGGGPFEPPRNGEEEPVKDRGAQRSNFAPESAAGRS